MIAALDAAVTSARTVSGPLRVGSPPSVGSPLLLELITSYPKSHPDCVVNVVETDPCDPYTPLRDGQIDLLYDWLTVDEPDISVSGAIEWRDRALAVSAKHPLASRTSVSIEELATLRVQRSSSKFPKALAEALVPATTPSGRQIPRSDGAVSSPLETIAWAASGRIVSPTVAGMPRYRSHPNIVLVPISDMPPLPLGLLWCTARENARIRSFVQTAAATRTRMKRQPG